MYDIRKNDMENIAKFPFKFFVIAFSWSWLFWLLLVLASIGIVTMEKDLLSTLILPIGILGSFGPAVGAFYCLRTLNGKGAVANYLRGLLDLNFGWRAWLAPILVLGGSTWVAWILPELWGVPRLEMLLPSIWVFPPYVIAMILLGGGQEELGWRGYILDFLEQRLGAWLGNLVLGVIWALWHLPLFFISGTGQSFMPFTGFILLMIGYSYFYAWVRESSGKRTLAGLVTHGWANAFVPLFPTIMMVEGATQPRFWIWVCLTFVIGLVTMVIRSRKEKFT